MSVTLFINQYILVAVTNTSVLNWNKKLKKKEKEKEKILHPQHFYSIFTTNYRWKVVIGSNFPAT